mgnify:CR=1 FL=1
MKNKWYGPAELCDICDGVLAKVFIDGKTHKGPWAVMCDPCHRLHGVGIGLGKGQKYNAKTRVKLEG